MNENTKLGAALLLAGALAAVAVIDNTKPVGSEKRRGPTLLAVKPDGGKGYVVLVETDAGIELREALAPGCVRRPAGAPAATCRFRAADGKIIDQGDLNRFDAANAVGGGCQPVACGVMMLEDAEEDEDARIARERGR